MQSPRPKAPERGPDMDAWRARLRAAGDASLPPSSPLSPSLARASSSAALKPPSRATEGRDDPFGFLAAERRRRSRRQLDSEMRPFASNSSSALSIAQRGPIPRPASVYCDAGDDYAARPSSRSSSIFRAETPRPARHLPVPSSSSSAAASAILHQALPFASRPASKSASSSRAVLRQKDANIPAANTESSSSASHKAKAKYKYKSDTKTARQHRKKRPDSPAVGMHANAPAAESDDGVVVDPEEEKRKRIAYFKALDEYELHKEDVYII